MLRRNVTPFSDSVLRLHENAAMHKIIPYNRHTNVF